jgi:hypothetical protein
MAEKWEEQVKNLKMEQAPESLLNRITTVVPHLKQEAAKGEQRGFFLRFVSEWRYGLALKVATFACVAVLGVMTGQAGAPEPDIVGSLVFGDIGWESVI